MYIERRFLFDACADLEGGSRGSGPPPPPEFAKLKIPDISGNEKKFVYFYFCALPPYNVKVGPPWKNFLDPRL